MDNLIINGENTIRQVDDLDFAARGSALYSWSNGLSKCNEFAQVIYLCPTNICNHRCVTCGYTKMRKGRKADGTNERGFMDFNLFKSIVDQLPNGYRRLYLQKTGESLMHPKICEMMEYIRKAKPEYELAIHTNASVLTSEISNAVMEYMDFFSMSIFGFDQNKYHSAHGKDDFDKVMKNIRRFRNIYKKSSNKIKVYFDVVRNKYNEDMSDKEIFSFLAKDFPEFNIGIHFPFNFQGFVDDYHNKVFKNLNRQYFPRCIWPWAMMAILWDGQVGYCVGDPIEKGILGDLKHEHVADVWNNERYQLFRKLIVNQKYDDLRKLNIHCGTCNWIFSLKSQSLSNLCMSSRKIISSTDENDISDIITNADDYLREGLKDYLVGDMANALKNITMVGITTKNRRLIKTAKEWNKNIKKVLGMRKYIEHWEEALNKEGLSLNKVHISHYKIADEQADIVKTQHHKLKDGLIVKKVDF